MIRKLEDVAIVGHAHESALTQYPSGHLVAYLDQWKMLERFQKSTDPQRTLGLSNNNHGFNYITDQDTNATKLEVTTTVSPIFPINDAPSHLGFIDVIVEQIDGLSESGQPNAQSISEHLRCSFGLASDLRVASLQFFDFSDIKKQPFLSWERSTENWSLLLILCPIGAVLLLAIAIGITVAVFRPRSIGEASVVKTPLLSSPNSVCSEPISDEVELTTNCNIYLSNNPTEGFDDGVDDPDVIITKNWNKRNEIKIV